MGGIHTRRAGAIVLAAVAAAGISACGAAKRSGRGGTLTLLSVVDLDSLDPGGASGHSDIFDAIDRRPYAYRPGDLTPKPDLASGPPVISDGGRRVTVHLRSDVRYSPPVGRAVVAGDVRYAIERGLTPSVSNPYERAYIGDLLGVRAFEQGRAPHITGITTPDEHTIVFRLRRPTVAALMGILSLPVSAPVPPAYARRFDRHARSDYGLHQVATGPYTIAARRDGRVTGYTAGQRLVLVRNPNWRRSSDVRPAYLDRIVVRVQPDASVAMRQIVAGHAMANVSTFFTPPPAEIASVRRRAPGQIALLPGGGFVAVALNTTVEPFDDINVRRAVIAGFDRRLVYDVLGGKPRSLVLASHFLSPLIPGFQEAGGVRGPGFDFLAHPGGDMALAARYMRKAGFPSGRYTGHARPLVVAFTGPVGEVVASQLRKLGFHVNLHEAPPPIAQSRFCYRPAARAAVCQEGWSKDFLDPQAVLDLNFNGATINPFNSPNESQLNDAGVNAAIDRAEAIVDARARARAWGAIDRRITSLAPAVPIYWITFVLTRSRDVNAVPSRFYAQWDLSYTSLRH